VDGTAVKTIFVKKLNNFVKNSTQIIEKINISNVDENLLKLLKELRINMARKKGVPAFVIFTDATLAELCRIMPVTEDEFLSVSGVGRNKLEKYGQEFMDVIIDYKENQGK
jgi:ATP-dependent DNA helicase RecQ